jgi:hypothetical protein
MTTCWICGEPVEVGQHVTLRATKSGEHPFAYQREDGGEHSVAHTSCEQGARAFVDSAKDFGEDPERQLRRAFKGLRGRR